MIMMYQLTETITSAIGHINSNPHTYEYSKGANLWNITWHIANHVGALIDISDENTITVSI